MDRILVILPNNYGDVLMATPVLAGLKKRHVDSKIDFLVEDGFDGGVTATPFIDDVIKLPRRFFRDRLRSSQYDGVIDELRSLIDTLNRRHYSAVVNLSQQDYVAYLCGLLLSNDFRGKRFLFQGCMTIGDTWSQYLYAVPFARRFNNLHAIDVYRRIAGVASKSCAAECSCVITNRERNVAAAFLQQNGIDPLGGNIMLFHPGAAFPAKCWPVDSFVSLGAMLIEDGWTVVLTGDGDDAQRTGHIAAGLDKQCFDTAGKLSFRESLALCSFCKGCVTGDTSMMHGAAAFDVTAYAIFGPTNPVETGPYGDGHFVVCGDCGERPCFRYHCSDMSCMTRVTPEILYQLIRYGRAAKDCRCAVYRTSFDKNGDYVLSSPTAEDAPYDDVGARLVRVPFETVLVPRNHEIDRSGVMRHEREITTVLSIVQSMNGALSAFRRGADTGAIREFERLKEDFSHCTGIGEFWSALFNIRVNSIPLLDIEKGLRQTMEVCSETIRNVGVVREEIKRLISPPNLQGGRP